MKYIYYFYDLYNRENYFSNDSLLNFPIDRYGTKYMYIDFGTDTQLLDVNNELKLEYFYNLKDKYVITCNKSYEEYFKNRLVDINNLS